jgi:hypothetical protein
LLWAVDVHRPQAIVVDSAQAFASPSEKGQRGGTAQIRRLTRDLVRLAKQSHVTVFLVGQTNDDGSVAGPKKLEFWVDTVIRYRRVARSSELREIMADKNRFGKEGDRHILAMTAKGLIDTGEVVTSESRAAARRERDEADRRGSKKSKTKKGRSSSPSSRPPPPPIPQRAVPLPPREGDPRPGDVLLPRIPPQPFKPIIVSKPPPSRPQLRVVPNSPEETPPDDDAVEPGAAPKVPAYVLEESPPGDFAFVPVALGPDTQPPIELESDSAAPEAESETESNEEGEEEEDGEEDGSGDDEGGEEDDVDAPVGSDEDPAVANRKKILREHKKQTLAESKFWQGTVDAAKKDAEAKRNEAEFQQQLDAAGDEIGRLIKENYKPVLVPPLDPAPDKPEPDGTA